LKTPQHKIMHLLFDNIDNAIARTGKSPQQIINNLTTLHPEITLSQQEWNELHQETKNDIISRIRRTLESMS